ncbi:hypothetical protein AQUCO_01900173v1 [Aquilegia coerulea]|uniref:Uncharacterized protein n=1 Tax=Aquilegia coerulea TaxID=218851 RepID=A0A2G5DJZ6_AQUCA|nr:hypothetical protein AQUCO_01900173v1 [Aquilegia coerulea]
METITVRIGSVYIQASMWIEVLESTLYWGILPSLSSTIASFSFFVAPVSFKIVYFRMHFYSILTNKYLC